MQKLSSEYNEIIHLYTLTIMQEYKEIMNIIVHDYKVSKIKWNLLNHEYTIRNKGVEIRFKNYW